MVRFLHAIIVSSLEMCFFFQAEDGIRDLVRSRGLGDVYKRQDLLQFVDAADEGGLPGARRAQDHAHLAPFHGEILSLIHI